MPMNRHAHMVDLLRPTLTLDEQIKMLHYKQELTVDDLDMIIANAKSIQKAAEIARSYLPNQRRT